MRVVFANRRSNNLDVYIVNERGIHYAETRFDIVIIREEGLGVAKSDSYHNDSSCCFASSKAVNGLRENLQKKIDGKAASDHTHPFKIIGVGTKRIVTTEEQLLDTPIIHNYNSDDYKVFITPQQNISNAHTLSVINIRNNHFDIRVNSGISAVIYVSYLIVSIT